MSAIEDLENDFHQLHYVAHLLAEKVEAECQPKGDIDVESMAFLAYNLEERVKVLTEKYLAAVHVSAPVVVRARAA